MQRCVFDKGAVCIARPDYWSWYCRNLHHIVRRLSAPPLYGMEYDEPSVQPPTPPIYTGKCMFREE